MFSKIHNWWQIVRESMFYVPAVMCGLYAVTSVAVFYIETEVAKDALSSLYLFRGDMSEARQLSGILMSSMITMTTLVVSVTMVVINLSASQLGPRMIRSVLSDNKMKFYIGCFFGSVCACFVLSGILHQLPDNADVPTLTLSYVFLASLVNLFILLAYVHHLAHLSVADSLVTKVHGDLLRHINQYEGFNDTPDELNRKKDLPKGFDEKSGHLHSGKSGYVQTIDYEAVKSKAQEEGLVIELLCKAGDYIVKGSDVAKVHPESALNPDIEKYISNAIVTGAQRTGSQDIEYSVRHLVEVGLRALSPGINDNYTAITVMNKLSSALAELFNKSLPSRVYRNGDGKLLAFGKVASQGDVVFEAFSHIRVAGSDKPDILSQLIRIMAKLIPLARTECAKDALMSQLKSLEENIADLPKSEDSRYLKKRLDELKALL